MSSGILYYLFSKDFKALFQFQQYKMISIVKIYMLSKKGRLWGVFIFKLWIIRSGIKGTPVTLINLEFLSSYANYYCFKTSKTIFLNITYPSSIFWNLDKSQELRHSFSWTRKYEIKSLTAFTHYSQDTPRFLLYSQSIFLILDMYLMRLFIQFPKS